VNTNALFQESSSDVNYLATTYASSLEGRMPLTFLQYTYHN